MTAVRKKLWPLKVILDDVNRIGMLKQAEAMAYTTLFSLVPSLAVVFTLVSLFIPFMGEQSALLSKVHSFILENLAAGSGEQAVKYLSNFIANLDIKKIGITSFAALIATFVLLLRQIEMALNRIWNVTEVRNMFIRFIYFWTFLTLGVFAAAIVIGAASSMHLDSLYAFLGIKEEVEATTSLFGDFFRSIATWAGIFCFFFLLFKVVPNTTVTARQAAFGALVASLMFHQGGRLYAYYISGFSKYASVYGALAAVPVFLMWLYLSWVIILFGALVSWRVAQGLPRQESEESFTTAETPLERLRNAHLQGILPLIVLLTVYHKFREGTGTGLTTMELAHKMKLPLSWIQDALDVLGKRNLIVTTISQESSAFFPAFPDQKLSLDVAYSELTRGAQEWMAGWKNDLPLDVQAKLRAIAKVANLNLDRLKTSTIADLI